MEDTNILRGAQESDNDDRSKEFTQAEAEKFLERHFNGWHSSKILIPPYFFNTVEKPGKVAKSHIVGDGAEKMLYDRLVALTSSPMCIINNVEHLDIYKHLEKDENKIEEPKDGEFDLMVIQRAGLISIQCKASHSESNYREAVKGLRKDREFLFSTIKTESPSVKNAIDKMICVIGLPNSTRAETEEKLKSRMKRYHNEGFRHLYRDDVKDSESFTKWWKGLTDSLPEMEQGDCKYLIARYVALSHLSYLDLTKHKKKHPPPVRFSDAVDNVAEKTSNVDWLLLLPKQRSVLDCNKPFVSIEGPAGTGKTQLLICKVKRMIEKEDHPKDRWWNSLILCCMKKHSTS